MSKVDLFDRNIEANQSPRNAFDCSFSSIFSSPAGLLLPAYVEDVKKDDKLIVDVTSVCRTRPVNTSAFMAFDQKVDFWYIPYRLIWSAYNQWRLSQSFPHSTSMMVDPGKQYLLPSTSWTSLYNALNTLPANSGWQYSTPEDATAAHALRMLDMLNYFAVPDKDFSFITPEEHLPTFEQTLGTKLKNLLVDNLDANGFLCNYFRLAAFQCVYMYGYRSLEFEPLEPAYFNCDSLFLSNKNAPVPNNTRVFDPSTLTQSSATNLVLQDTDSRIDFNKLFTPRFKNWRKDQFTALKPSTSFDDSTAPYIASSGLAYSGQSGTSFDWPVNIQSLSPEEPTFPGEFGNRASTPASIANPSQNVNGIMYAQNIYQLLAQDKFSRAMLYADKDYKSQMQALFGKFKDLDNHTPKYLGSYSCDVEISDVVATASGSAGTPSTSSVLGEIAGKGYGNSNSHAFEAEFDEDGIVLGIHYIMPRNNYDSYRTSRFNTKVSRFDYFYPQFDGLGLQPTYAYERGTQQVTPVQGTPNMIPANSIIGFSPRYCEYKTRQSETHGSFMNGQPDYDWTLSNNTSMILDGSNIHNFKIMPWITDRLFTVAYDGSISTDPFICYFNFNVTRVSNLEAFGTPSL